MKITINFVAYDIQVSDQKLDTFNITDQKNIIDIISNLHPATDLLELSKFSNACFDNFDYMPYNSTISDIIEIWMCRIKKISYIWKKINTMT